MYVYNTFILAYRIISICKFAGFLEFELGDKGSTATEPRVEVLRYIESIPAVQSGGIAVEVAKPKDGVIKVTNDVRCRESEIDLFVCAFGAEYA